jgi:hypothetical protein
MHRVTTNVDAKKNAAFNQQVHIVENENHAERWLLTILLLWLSHVDPRR